MPYILIRGNLASYSHKYPWRVLVSGLKADDIEQLSRFPCGGYSDESTLVYLVHPCVILTALEVLGYRVVASSSTAVKQDYNEYMWTMRKEFSVQGSLVNQDNESALIRENVSNVGREAVLGSYHKSNLKKKDELKDQVEFEDIVSIESISLMIQEMDTSTQKMDTSTQKMDTSTQKMDTPTQTPQPPTTTTNVVTIPVPIVPHEDTYAYVAVKGSLHAQDCSIFGLNHEEKVALAKRVAGGSTEIINGILVKYSPLEVLNMLSKLGYKVICSSGEAETCWTMQREV